MPTGDSVTYVAATGHRPLPMAGDTRRRRAPSKPVPTGLDWSKHRAPAASERPVVEQPARPVAPKPAQPRRTTKASPATSSTPVRDDATLVRLYVEEGLTVPEIAAQLRHAKSTVRNVLIRRGVELRDDRAHNGGHNRKTADQDPPELVADVRTRYVDQGQSLKVIAAAVDSTPKVIAGVLRRAGVILRTTTTVAVPEGLSSLQVKRWAYEQGLIPAVCRGRVSSDLVAAYLKAHQ